jgi:hypothetical protein
MIVLATLPASVVFAFSLALYQKVLVKEFVTAYALSRL